MAVTLLQTATGTPGTGSVTATFTNPTIPGSLIIAFQGHTTNNDTPGTPTDNAGNTYTTSYQPNSFGIVQLAFVANARSTTAVTIAPNGSASVHSLIIREYGGMSQNKPLDQQTSTSGTGTAIDSGASPTTRDANELVVCSAVLSGSTPTLSVGANFGNLVTDNFGGTGFIHGVEDRLVTSKAAYNGLMTGGASGNWDGGVASFFEEYGQIGGRYLRVGSMSRSEVAN